MLQGGPERARDYKVCITREERRRGPATRVRGRRARFVSWRTMLVATWPKVYRILELCIFLSPIPILDFNPNAGAETRRHDEAQSPMEVKLAL